MPISLLKTHTMPFFRPTKTFNATRRVWEEGVPVSLGNVQGSLQPIRRSEERELLPEGVKTTDARLFYTKTLLQGYSEFNPHGADYTTIGGREFFIEVINNWDNYGLLSDHYKYFLIAKEKSVEGN